MILLLAACAENPSPETEDSASVALVCTDEVTATLHVTAVATAPRLEWSTATAMASRIRFTNGDSRTRETIPTAPGTEHEAVLVGIVPEAEFAWQVLVEDDDGVRCVGEGSGTNGPLPAGVPQVTSTVAAGSTPGLLVVPLLSGAQFQDVWLVVFDEEGRVVWAVPPIPTADVVVYVTTAAFSKDGSGVLFNVQAQSATGPGWIGKVTFDGVYSTVAEVVGLHTDFVELEQGRLAALTWEVRDVGDFRLLGDHVVVVEEGVATSIWNAFDSVPFDTEGQWPTGFYLPDPTVLDWSHVNSISWDGASNDLVVTMTASDGLARIDADTGEMLWLYGAGMGDFSGAEGLTAAPHSAEILPSGNVLVFNRGDFVDAPAEVCSFAAELAVNEPAMAEVGQWTAEACTLTIYLGLARRLSDGVTLLNWCSAGRIDQVSDAGETVWSVGLGAGHGFGNSSFLPTAQ